MMSLRPLVTAACPRWAGVVGVALALGCAPRATIRHQTVPAAARPDYRFVTFTLAPPAADAWRLAGLDWNAAWVWFSHADHAAILAAFWDPLAPPNAPAAAERFLRDRVLGDVRALPEYRLVMIQPETAASIQGIDYRHWELELTRFGPNTQAVFAVSLYARVEPARSEQFVFLAATERPDTGAVFRELVAGARYPDYAPAQVALARLAIAYARFREVADTEQKDRDPAALHLARTQAETEAEQARRLCPDAPQPWNILGELAEYDTAGLRYGAGFDASRAERCFRSALVARPSFGPACENLAQLYEFLDRPADAEREWRAAIEAAPSHYGYHYELGRFYQRHRRESDALASFREALRFWRGAALTRVEVEKTVTALEKRLGRR